MLRCHSPSLRYSPSLLNGQGGGGGAIGLEGDQGRVAVHVGDVIEDGGATSSRSTAQGLLEHLHACMALNRVPRPADRQRGRQTGVGEQEGKQQPEIAGGDVWSTSRSKVAGEQRATLATDKKRKSI